MPEHICSIPTFQNGGYTNPQEPRETRRLVCEGGPEGCLFLSPDQSGPQEIPVFHTGEKMYQFTCLPFSLTSAPRAFTLGLYQDPQDHSSSRTGAGVSSGNLHRRHTAEGRVERDGTSSGHSPDISSTVPGFHHKRRENGDNANTIDRIPGVQCKDTIDGIKPSSNEAENNPGGVPETDEGGANISPTPFQTDWQNECCQLSHPTSTSVLQMPTNGSVGSTKEIGSGL